MRRWAVLLAMTAGCEAPAEQAAPLPALVYPAQPTVWPVGAPRGSIGRAQAPQVTSRSGITGSAGTGLRLATTWQIPGDVFADAVVYGSLDDGAPAVDLIEIDTGRVVWRDTTACAAVVVGVTAEGTIVCADGKGVRAVGIDGKARWKQEGAGFVAMTDERVAVTDAGEVVIVDADAGDELARVKLPSGITSDAVLATCGDAGRELFASGQDNQLVRIAEMPGGPKVAWSVATDRVIEIDACIGKSVLVTVESPRGLEMLAMARDTGRILGTVSGVLGHWRARDGSPGIEIATTTGITRWSRELAGTSQPLETLVVGALLATRADMRLVRASQRTAVLLDRKGVRAFLPLAELGAVLGNRALIASTWTGSRGETVHRIPYPPRYDHALRLERGPPRSINVPAELRDLPPPVEVELAKATAVDNVRGDIKAIALTETALHVLVDAPPAIASLTLQGGTWRQTRHECGSGEAFTLAADRDQVVCVTRDRGTASVHGATWTWRTTNVDRIAIAGRVVLVWDADRVTVLDAKTGAVRGSYASEDGAAMPAAALDISGMALIVTAEADRVVARLPDAQMTPAWSVAVSGVVLAIEAVGEGVLVTLEDGDAYRIDARTGDALPIGGISADWRVAGDLITSAGSGGPIPPAHWPAAAPQPTVAPKQRTRPKAKASAKPADDASPPRLMIPVAPPPDLAPSWQLALFESVGGTVARNDYALTRPITPAPRVPRALVVVVVGDADRQALVLDPVRGDPVRRVRLPDDAVPGTVFSTVVDGAPVVGMLLANPLRVVLF